MTHLLSAVLVAVLAAVDVSGTWTGTLTPDGQEAGPALLVLRQEGAAVTGTVGGGENDRLPIRKGTIENDVVTLEVETPAGVMKFVLKQNGDELTGAVTRERDGQLQKATLAVKRTAPPK